MRTFFICCLFFICNLSFAQTDISEASFKIVSDKIANKQQLTDTENALQLMLTFAVNENKPIAKIRCLYYQVLIKDVKTEDTLYFKNSAALEKELKQNDFATTKAMLHLLMAKRISYFKNYYFNRAKASLFKNEKMLPNYATFTNHQLDSVIHFHYKEAIENSLNSDNQKIEEFIWLSQNPLLFLYKPILYDVANAEYISYCKQNKYLNFYNANYLDLSADELMQQGDTLTAFKGDAQKVFTLYKNWASSYTKNPQAYYYIETLMRLYFSQFIYSENKQLFYEKYLDKLVQSPYNTVKAAGVFYSIKNKMQQATGYNNVEINYGNIYTKTFDTSKRLLFVQAKELYHQQKAVLDSFAYLKDDIEIGFEYAQQPMAKAWIKDYQLPNIKPIIYLRYKNCTALHLKISAINSIYNLQNKVDSIERKAIENLPIFKEQIVKLPDLNDWQYHNGTIFLESLPAGTYVIQYKPVADKESTNKFEYTYLTITNIAVINSDEKVFVLNRNTGKPLQKVTVSFGKIINKQQIFEESKHTVNAQGFVVNKNDKQFAKVFYGNDTAIFTAKSNATGNFPRDAYYKEDFDTKQDFYEEKLAIQIFTDRAIYRPGQIVYFKGIATIPDVHTGKPLPLTIKNLKLPFFQKIYLKYLKAFTKKRPQIYINDAFSKAVDTIKFTPNKYGSFWGKYVIPKNAPTGEWNFDNDYGDDNNRNDGAFKVEEYKRPTYEITIEKPKAELYLTDSVAIKVKVKSFAGVQLNNVKIEYSINKSYSNPIETILAKGLPKQELFVTIGYTNDKGELLIKIPANEVVKSTKHNDSVNNYIQYYINAEAVDETGEAYEANVNFRLSNQPVRISNNLPRFIDNNNIPTIKITTNHDLFGSVQKMVKVQLFKINNQKEKDTKNELPQDVDLATGLYKLQIASIPKSENNILQYEIIVKSNSSNTFTFPENKLAPGNYLVKYYAIETGKIIGSNTSYFKVYDTKQNQLPNNESFDYLPVNTIKNKDTLKWVIGNADTDELYYIYHISYFAKNNKKIELVNDYVFANEIYGIKTFSYKIPENAIERININRLNIYNNNIYQDGATVFIYNEAEVNPEIIVQKYRTTLLPGGKQIFKVNIKTKNKNTLAELMSTMYDASLDKIEKHEWHLPREANTRYFNSNWNSTISSFNSFDSRYSVYDNNLFNNRYNFPAKNGNVEPLWWLNPLDYAYDEFPKLNGKTFINDTYDPYNKTVNVQNGLQGRVAGLNVSEVVVTSALNRKSLEYATATSVIVRGVTSLSAYSQPLIILDDVVFTGDLKAININSIVEGITLKGADAENLYGAKAVNGVLILSTKGPIQFPQSQEPQLIVRKNFNETAFFLPAIHADKNGFYNLEFTMPESVTEWKWKLFAHTKKMEYSYLEKTIYTQLPLMVQPNMPRFLYQGDKIKLQSRISNLDTAITNGKIECIVEDAVTGENLTSKIIQQNSQQFTVAAKSNSSSGFYLSIPNNLLNPIKIIVKVIGKNFADGEEHMIPILAKKILVTQAVPYAFNTLQTTIITPTLPADAVPYAQGIYVTPQPQSALVNALPGLAFYKFNCAEQLSGKILAYFTAISLMRKDNELQKSYATLLKNNNEDLKQLPDEINEETMPWLQLQKYTANHQLQLIKLLDTLNAKQQIETILKELLALQNTDGGFTWFKGGRTDKYISEYLLQVFGKITQLQIIKNDALITGVKKLINYVDEANNSNPTISTNYMYARSFWVAEFALSETNKGVIKKFIASQWGSVGKQNLYHQALLILNTQTFFDGNSIEYKKAIAQIKSIEQVAIIDEENGMRWKDLADEDDLSNSSEETIALLATVFKNNGKDTAIVNNIIKWLLTAKQEHSWSSTKSTASVVQLLTENKIVTTQPTTVFAKINDTKIEASNNLIQNKLANMVLINQSSFQINTTLTQQKTNEAKGNVLYYFFTENPPINNTNILLKKELLYFNKQTQKDEIVTETTLLKTGDKVSVTLTIETQKLLQYVFIEDKRAAALEPVDNLSGYEYGNSIGYYKSVRDIGVQFFANSITPGKHTITYDVTVTKEGIFTNGITSLQCMYKPGVKVYNSGGLSLINCKGD